MKRFSIALCACMIAMSTMTVCAFADGTHTLDEIISGGNSSSVSTDSGAEASGNSGGSSVVVEEPGNGNGGASTGKDSFDSQIDSLQQAASLPVSDSEGASKINQGVSKVAGFVVQVLAYAATALLALRVLLDLIYIAIPFSRSFLANGYGGNAQAGSGGMPGAMGGMPGAMGGMSPMGGMGGMGMGGYGGRYGGMGMGGMAGGMGMGMPGAMQQGMSQPGASPAMGRIQWISNAALNAVAAETVVGPDGKPVNPLKIYAKDMIIILVITPIFLILAVTGALTKLGIIAGELIAEGIANIGNMI